MEAPPAVERVEVEPGLELRVELHGRRSDGVPLVLVHGFMGSAAAWGDLPRRLARRRPVVVPELPGHGGSDRPRDPEVYAVPRIASMLARTAEALDGVGADWLGYSMGGRIVLAGAAEGHLRPRRLVVESTSPGLSDDDARAARRELDESRAAALLADGIEPFVDAWLALPLFATQRRLAPAVRARERIRRLGADPAALAACLRGGGTGSQPSYWPALAALDVPVLLLTGGADRKFVDLADAMAARMPRARRVTVPGAGHAVHLERADAWLEAVEAFLDAERP
ncbi:MAG: 2-succinyl-6-hydroxy-2,4-cyclohexadiene-1-carboxylate synthase [Longimicrobiales bacterium]